MNLPWGRVRPLALLFLMLLLTSCSQQIDKKIEQQTYQTAWFGLNQPVDTNGYSINGVQTGGKADPLLVAWNEKFLVVQEANRFCVTDEKTGSSIEVTVDENGFVLAVESVLKSGLEKNGVTILRLGDPRSEISDVTDSLQVESWTEIIAEQMKLSIDAGQMVRKIRLVERSKPQPSALFFSAPAFPQNGSSGCR